MPKHNNASMAQALHVSQREEAACRATVIQLSKELNALKRELETVTFDRNYYRDKAETQEQTIKLLQRKVEATEGITINIHSGFNKP